MSDDWTFTDFMLVKFIVTCVIAFIYVFLTTWKGK